jgi:hypothetical protein
VEGRDLDRDTLRYIEMIKLDDRLARLSSGQSPGRSFDYLAIYGHCCCVWNAVVLLLFMTLIEHFLSIPLRELVKPSPPRANSSVIDMIIDMIQTKVFIFYMSLTHGARRLHISHL